MKLILTSKDFLTNISRIIILSELKDVSKCKILYILNETVQQKKQKVINIMIDCKSMDLRKKDITRNTPSFLILKEFGNVLYSKIKADKKIFFGIIKIIYGIISINEGNNNVTKYIKDDKLLCSQWNYEKNKDLDISTLLFGSNKKVWWKSEKCNYEQEAVISSRNAGAGCPKCHYK